jgi:hypothetical protein
MMQRRHILLLLLLMLMLRLLLCDGTCGSTHQEPIAAAVAALSTANQFNSCWHSVRCVSSNPLLLFTSANPTTRCCPACQVLFSSS